MILAGKVLFGVIGAALTYETAIQVKENVERHDYFRWARNYCDAVGKPLLRIGMRRGFLEPPNGDVTLDIDPEVLNIPGGVLGDERLQPFYDKEFGVCFNEHTLEHLLTTEDVELAVNECRRVADVAILLCPSPYSLHSTFFCPSHRLRLWFDNDENRIIVRPNNWRTGIGKIYPGDTGGVPLNQSMVMRYEEIKSPIVING
jgi:hypothetical protein